MTCFLMVPTLMTLNDLFGDFLQFSTAEKWIATKWMEINQDYLQTGTAIGSFMHLLSISSDFWFEICFATVVCSYCLSKESNSTSRTNKNSILQVYVRGAHSHFQASGLERTMIWPWLILLLFQCIIHLQLQLIV